MHCSNDHETVLGIEDVAIVHTQGTVIGYRFQCSTCAMSNDVPARPTLWRCSARPFGVGAEYFPAWASRRVPWARTARPSACGCFSTIPRPWQSCSRDPEPTPAGRRANGFAEPLSHRYVPAGDGRRVINLRLLVTWLLLACALPTCAALQTAGPPPPDAAVLAAPTTITTSTACLRSRAAFYYPWFPETWVAPDGGTYTNYTPTAGLYDSGTLSTIARRVDG